MNLGNQNYTEIGNPANTSNPQDDHGADILVDGLIGKHADHGDIAVRIIETPHYLRPLDVDGQRWVVLQAMRDGKSLDRRCLINVAEEMMAKTRADSKITITVDAK